MAAPGRGLEGAEWGLEGAEWGPGGAADWPGRRRERGRVRVILRGRDGQRGVGHRSDTCRTGRRTSKTRREGVGEGAAAATDERVDVRVVVDGAGRQATVGNRVVEVEGVGGARQVREPPGVRRSLCTAVTCI